MIEKIVLLLGLVVLGSSYSLSMFWCGFHWSFCGHSQQDDVNNKADFVNLAFANINPNGSILVDEANFPYEQVQNWQSSGKKVLLAVGGASGNWSYAFNSNRSISEFVTSLSGAVLEYNLDGVTLDISSYGAAPLTVAQMIKSLKRLLRTRLLTVSAQCVTVYQGTAVTDPQVGGNPFNYLVPIIQEAGFYIDYYQVQAYNNWYDGFTGGSLDYLIDVYLNWRNFQGLSPHTRPINGFSGVPGNKILIGLLGSSNAGSQYYTQPSTIQAFKNYLLQNGYPLKGFMIWDSYWDSQNKYLISNQVKI